MTPSKTVPRSPRATSAPPCATPSTRPSSNSTAASCASPRRSTATGRLNEWVKKAVLLSFRINDNEFIKGGFTNYYDKVPSKFADYNSRDFREGGVRVVPPATARHGSYIAPTVRADAVLRQHRRLRRRRHHGRHLGHRRLLRPDRQERAPVRRRRHRRRARAAAGRPDHHRGQLLHRRPLRGRRRRDRRGGRGDLDGRLHRPEHHASTTARPTRSATAASRPARWWSPATCPRRTASTACTAR